MAPVAAVQEAGVGPAVAAARAAAVQEAGVGPVAGVEPAAGVGPAVGVARVVAGQLVAAVRVEGPAASAASPAPGEHLSIRASMREAPLG